MEKYGETHEEQNCLVAFLFERYGGVCRYQKCRLYRKTELQRKNARFYGRCVGTAENGRVFRFSRSF